MVRHSPQGHTQDIIDIVRKKEKIWIGMAPEGTRKQAENIRSGFYHIAYGANIPIVMFSFDYAHKTIHILGVFHPTGDYAQDLDAIYTQYHGKFSAKNPHWLAKPLQKLLKKG